jgi:mannose-6-phosphate isomerase-like protein (cupin superfamily)
MRAALVLLSAAVLHAVAPAPVRGQHAEPPISTETRIVTPAALAALGDSMPGAVSSRTILRFEGLRAMLARRDSMGAPERHERFTDIFVIQRGVARLRYGGTTESPRQTSPGEWIGGTIRGGTESDLHPGDVVVIPAGIPHQMVLAPGQRIDYLAFKVPKDTPP